MNEKDAARLQWLKDNPTKTYNDLPQGLWDDSRVAAEVALQQETQRNGPQLRDGPQQPWPFHPFA